MDVVFFVSVTVIESLVEKLIVSDLLEKVMLVSARLGMKVLDVKAGVDCTPVELLLPPEADRAELHLNVLMSIELVSDDAIAVSLLEVMILDSVEEAEMDESSISILARYNTTHQQSGTHFQILILTGC